LEEYFATGRSSEKREEEVIATMKIGERTNEFGGHDLANVIDSLSALEKARIASWKIEQTTAYLIVKMFVHRFPYTNTGGIRD